MSQRSENFSSAEGQKEEQKKKTERRQKKSDYIYEYEKASQTQGRLPELVANKSPQALTSSVNENKCKGKSTFLLRECDFLLHCNSAKGIR